MSLNFVLGDVGSGKTRYLYEKALELAESNREKTIYFIVPEQFTMQTQYDLVMASPTGGILNIDVTSLARLSHKAFEAVPGSKRTFLPEIGKSMIIKRVLADKKDQLLLFAKNVKQAGFVAKTKALISELYQYSVGVEELEELMKEAEKESPVLYKKLRDSMAILEGFEDKLSGKYLTNEGVYDAFADIAEKSGILKNSIAVLDGFTGFTPSQYEMLKKLLKNCDEVWVSFTITEEAYKKQLKEYDLFYTSKKSIESLCHLANSVKTDTQDYIWVGPTVKNGQSWRWSSLPKEAVSLYSADDIVAEARYVSMEVERLVREEGYRYRDIAIVTTDIDNYGEVVADELDKVHALYFLDRKKALYENECAAYILSILAVMEKENDVNRLIDYAKNSLSGIDYEDACLLENYCLAMGIKGYAFKKPFTKECYGKMDISLERVENARTKLYESLSELMKVRKGTASELSEILMNALEKAGLEERLEARAEQFKAQGDKLRAKEYSAVFPAVQDIITQLVEFLGNEEMNVKEFRETVEAGLSEAKVRLVPLTSDYLVIGDLERTRLKNIKALFVMGVNDGLLMKNSAGNSLFTEQDKARVKEFGCELSPGRFEKTGRDKFYLYMALRKPIAKLYISYAGKTSDGAALKPASLVRDIMKQIPESSVKTVAMLSEAERVLSNDLGKETELKYRRTVEEERLKTAEYQKERLKPEIADMLYGEKLKGSISRLENFASCPFKHFVNYGLGLLQRDEFTLESNDFGTTAHAALQYFGEEVRSQSRKWYDLSETEREALVRSSTDKAMQEYKGGIFESDETRKYTAERIKEALTLTVDMMCYKLSGTDFVPASFEASVKKGLHIAGADFGGSIDRIDVCEQDGLKAVKIVDYKSSAHEFDLLRLYYGLSLQLPTYMLSAINMFKDYKPAAMLYDVINEPLVEDKGDDTANLEELRKSFKTKGLVNEEAEILKSLDYAFKTEAGGVALNVKSSKIPVNTVKEIKNGKLFDGYSQTASDEEFAEILNYTNQKLSYMVGRIKAGDISRTPYALGGERGCEYCSYRSICGFDEEQGCRVRRLTNYDKEEVKEKLMRSKRKNSGSGEEE